MSNVTELEEGTSTKVQLIETELEEARSRVRSAIEGLDPAAKLFVAVSALVGDGAGEIAVTDPGTGRVACYIMPASVKLARDASARALRRNEIATGVDASLDALIKMSGQNSPTK